MKLAITPLYAEPVATVELDTDDSAAIGDAIKRALDASPTAEVTVRREDDPRFSAVSGRAQ